MKEKQKGKIECLDDFQGGGKTIAVFPRQAGSMPGKCAFFINFIRLRICEIWKNGCFGEIILIILDSSYHEKPDIETNGIKNLCRHTKKIMSKSSIYKSWHQVNLQRTHITWFKVQSIDISLLIIQPAHHCRSIYIS